MTDSDFGDCSPMPLFKACAVPSLKYTLCALTHMPGVAPGIPQTAPYCYSTQCTAWWTAFVHPALFQYKTQSPLPSLGGRGSSSGLAGKVTKILPMHPSSVACWSRPLCHGQVRQCTAFAIHKPCALAPFLQNEDRRWLRISVRAGNPSVPALEPVKK